MVSGAVIHVVLISIDVINKSIAIHVLAIAHFSGRLSWSACIDNSASLTD